MFWARLRRTQLSVHVGVVAVLSMLVAIAMAILPQLSIGAVTAAPNVEGIALSSQLTYQGRIVNPSTGAPQTGSLAFSFRLYNVESGGVALWTENKDVVVTTNGLFSTVLGDTTPIPASIFTGQPLWLGIKVNADPEATPRQRLSPVAYAMYADNADRLDGLDSTALRNADNINAGTVNDARLPDQLTRDSEVMGIVTTNDGAGSTVDADLLDGNDSTSFFKGGKGTQLANQTLPAGGTVTWTSFGYSTNDMVIWWAVPRTPNGKLNTTVETHLEGCCGAGEGKITYWITVRNTSNPPAATNYDLIRYSFGP